MGLFNLNSLIIFIGLLFIMGLSVGIYNGDELIYKGIQTAGSNSTITQGITKILDGGLTLAYEFANILGKGAVEKGINLNKIVRWGITLFWVGVILIALSSVVKLFLYIYIIRRELEMSKKERELLFAGNESAKRFLSNYEKKHRKRAIIWYIVIGLLILLSIIFGVIA